jgi:hypothetical protein
MRSRFHRRVLHEHARLKRVADALADLDRLLEKPARGLEVAAQRTRQAHRARTHQRQVFAADRLGRVQQFLRQALRLDQITAAEAHPPQAVLRPRA